MRGWLFPASGAPHGLIVYLHGIADNRASGIGIASRFTPLGYDVLAYDSRGHGASDDALCTYGYLEKIDLSHALDAVGARSAVLFGSSLGAAGAIQAAAVESRVRGVVAVSPFCDLETIVHDRAPWFVASKEVAAALAIAEERAHFRIAEASPLRAAPRVAVPVLLIHGAEDRETSPVHSRRIYDALGGPKELLLVPRAGHNDALARSEVWAKIDEWLKALGPWP